LRGKLRHFSDGAAAEDYRPNYEHSKWRLFTTMASVFAPVTEILLAGRDHEDRDDLADALSAALTDAAASKGEDQGQQATDELKVVDSLAAVLQCSRWASIEYAFP
jgi:5-carboxymethyl-2-hydroxymuconate isomerase